MWETINFRHTISCYLLGEIWLEINDIYLMNILSYTGGKYLTGLYLKNS